MRLLTGDSAQVLKTLDTQSIDLTVTSPPYDTIRYYNGFVFDVLTIIKELFRVTKDGGVVIWVVGDETSNGTESGTSFKQALMFKEVGFNLHDTMIYAKQHTVPLTHRRYEQMFEYMFVFSKGRPKTFNPILLPCKLVGEVQKTAQKREVDGRLRERTNTNITKSHKIKGNIWIYTTSPQGVATDSLAFRHPAIYPEQLAADHISSWSNENDVILDPFLGSGTTGKMALMMNRKFIGIDISDEYIKLAKERMSLVGDSLNRFLTKDSEDEQPKILDFIED